MSRLATGIELARPPARLRERVLASVGRRPLLAAAVGRRTRWAVLGIGVLLVGIGFGEVGGAAALSHPERAVLATGWVAALMTAGALRRPQGTFGPSVVQLAGAAILGPIALVIVALVTGREQIVRAATDGTTHASHAPLVAALGMLLVFWALSPPADPTRASLRGAALGGAAGAWLAASCAMTCPSLDVAHVLARHTVYVPLLAAAGAVCALLYDRVLFGARSRSE